MGAIGIERSKQCTKKVRYPMMSAQPAHHKEPAGRDPAD